MVNESALRAAGASSESPPNNRQKIFYELVASENRAIREADAHDPKFSMKHLQFVEERQRQYREDLRRKFNLTEKQLEQIIAEGLSNNWPQP